MKFEVLCHQLFVSSLALVACGAGVSFASTHPKLGGAINCNSQEDLNDDGECQPRGAEPCNDTYKQCNQEQGTATRLCESKGSSRDGCSSQPCKPRDNDALSQDGPDGNPCEETYIEE